MTKRSFEELVAAGVELARVEAENRWKWGEKLATMPDDLLKAYAEAVGQEYETLKGYQTESAQTRFKF